MNVQFKQVQFAAFNLWQAKQLEENLKSLCDRVTIENWTGSSQNRGEPEVIVFADNVRATPSELEAIAQQSSRYVKISCFILADGTRVFS